MAEKKLLLKEKLDSTGLFDYFGLYSYVYSWLDDRKYIITEKEYIEKMAGSARSIYFKWEAKRKISDYFGIEMEIEVTTIDMTDVEVEIDKQKKKMNKGKLNSEIKCVLVRDIEHKWEGSPFLRFWRDIYNKYIIPARVEDYEIEAYNEAVALKEEMKAFLELTGKRKVTEVLRKRL